MLSKSRQLLRITIGLSIVLFASASLTGCLVKKKELEKFARTTDNLRVYQPGDYIVYNVSGHRVTNGGLPETITGTLRVDWDLHSNLTVPFSGGTSIPIIQEKTNLNLNNGATNEGTIRYISQDANGQVTLHAIEGIDSATDEHYWLNSEGIATPDTIESFTVFNSPIAFGDQDFDGKPEIDFRILEGCDSPGASSCNSQVGQFIENHNVVGESTERTTNLGIFINPFQINFSGSATPDASVSSFPVPFDIRTICGTDYYTTHSGVMYVMPEIGVIEMHNNCVDQSNQNAIYFTLTLSHISFALPY